jgi:deoxyribodipyrimidine photolyase-related protein
MSGRRLLLVLGDQLSAPNPLLAEYRAGDVVVMVEARAESTRIWSHKARTALFLTAMRHYGEWLRTREIELDYVRIDAPEAGSFASAVTATVRRRQPTELVMVEAGEHGVQQEIVASAAAAGIGLRVLEDARFLCGHDQFQEWRQGRRSLLLESFYRTMRRTHGILVEDGQPVGGRWNFDRANRKAFGRQGPGMLPAPPAWPANDLTRTVLRDVQNLFPDNPGSLARFNWPVTPAQARQMLDDFVNQRLPAFGRYQDAMWDGEWLLYHSGLSAAMNLKLLDPRAVLDAVLAAYQAGHAELAAVEGFVRQVLGWREYVRGVYWDQMPGYLDENALGAELDLPVWYWTGDTDMHCLAAVIGQTLEYGYAHHIQRLMVTGLFALLLGVRPRALHEWYLAMYVDAVEWVELPNTLGMSQHADGGLLASKPYAASGRYIARMSNYCAGCRYRPEQATGADACPFTTLYWDFLLRHESRFADHPRAAMQWRALQRIDGARRRAIRTAAATLRQRLA